MTRTITILTKKIVGSLRRNGKRKRTTVVKCNQRGRVGQTFPTPQRVQMMKVGFTAMMIDGCLVDDFKNKRQR